MLCGEVAQVACGPDGVTRAAVGREGGEEAFEPGLAAAEMSDQLVGRAPDARLAVLRVPLVLR
jgi:hypothetical protein